MHHPATKHTLDIFKRIYDKLPPLVPDEIKKEMKEKFDEAMEDGELTLEELEDIMITYGKKVWPYIQAFEKIYEVYKHELSEQLFHQRASQSLKEKYDFFKETGGSFHDLHSGAISIFFDHNERSELAALLVDLDNELRQHTYQAVLSHDRDEYEDKIDHYKELLEEAEEHFQALEKLIDSIEYKYFVEDIKDHLRAFEYSFSFLGPKIAINEIRGIKEYYEGRLDEVKYRI